MVLLSLLPKEKLSAPLVAVLATASAHCNAHAAISLCPRLRLGFVATAAVRVEVGHSIGGVKVFRIVADTFGNIKEGFVDLVMETACGLFNLRLASRALAGPPHPRAAADPCGLHRASRHPRWGAPSNALFDGGYP